MNPLDNLKDIHVPTDVSIWPLAIGWWVLIFAVLSLIIATIWLFIRYRKKRKIQRLALAELTNIKQQQLGAQQLNMLLKKAALGYFPHEWVASLHGKHWADFLIQQLPAKHQSAFAHEFELLQQSLYQKQRSDQLKSFYQLTELWLKNALPAKPARQRSYAVSKHVEGAPNV